MLLGDWEVVPEGHEIRPDGVYRSAWFIRGPNPPSWVTLAIYSAITNAAKLSKRYAVISQETFFKEQVAVLKGPHDTWMYRLTWRKTAPGSPLLFFCGPAGIITLVIVGIVALTVGAVIVLRQTEESLPKIADDIFNPGVVVAALLVVGLVVMGVRK